jgi:hypothetical protein
LQLTPYYYPGWVIAGDFTGSGLPDLAVTEVKNGHDLGIMLNKVATDTGLVVSTNPSVSGQALTFLATVTAQLPGSLIPKGTVTFMVDGAVATTVKLDGTGQAVYSTSSLKAGRHRVIAIYSGGANFITSTSASLVQVVNKDASVESLLSSPNPSAKGQTVVFTVTLGAAVPGSGTPTGTVSFFFGSTLLATRTLTSGSAVFRISTLPLGSDSIKVVYSGDSQFLSSSATIIQVVIPGGPNVVLPAALLVADLEQPAWSRRPRHGLR